MILKYFLKLKFNSKKPNNTNTNNKSSILIGKRLKYILSVKLLQWKHQTVYIKTLKRVK